MGSLRHRIFAMTGAMAGLFAALVAPVRGFAVDILDDPIQIDERVSQLIQTSNSLCWEMHRYHQQQPDFAEAYKTAKQLWTEAGQVRDALRLGPMETELLQRQTAEMSQSFAQLEKTLAKWGSGDRSLVPANSGPTQREVVTQGVGVDIPFVGVRVGGPRVIVTEDGPPQLERRRLHPNSHGSKRSLERELAAVKVALSYLVEDAGMGSDPNSPQPTATESKPTPQPPEPDSTLIEPRTTTSESGNKPK